MSETESAAIGHALVTGAGGFIGRHLTASLVASGIEVTALDLELATLEPLASVPGLRRVQASIEDAAARVDALAGIDTVFHLAAAHLGALRGMEEFHRVNVDATRSLAQESIQSKVRRFVHCSSVGVYGRIESPPADEETACLPELDYERTKLAGEREILHLAEKAGLPAVILRPTWVYGPGCHRTQKLFSTIARNRFLVAGAGDGYRHCIFIDDMVGSMIQAAICPGVEGEVFVIGDDRPTTIRTLVDTIAALTNSPPPRAIPFGLMNALATTSEILFKVVNREPPVSRRSLRFFTGNTAFKTDKARKMLGLKPRYDLESGLAETYRRISGEL